jgi:hypothetical protein
MVIVRALCPFRNPVLVSVRWCGCAPITAVSSASISVQALGGLHVFADEAHCAPGYQGETRQGQ